MRYIYTFLIMFGFWILLSGKFDLFHLTLGVISSGLVSFLSADILMHESGRSDRLSRGFRFISYIPWLLYQIVLSTIHVAFLALHPKMKDQIDPTIVTFKTKLTSNIARVALANSITLTPGTITIRIEDNVFYVHAISRKAAAGLPGEMEDRLARVFERE
jgi:multicomponent Na+:H+ antiporter subunit E